MKKAFVVCASLSFVLVSVVSSIASDWSFYGSARMTPFMYEESEEVTGTGSDDKDLTWDLLSTSRFGGIGNSGPVGFRVEVSPQSGKMLRLFYGTWKFGPATLLVGHDYTPVYYPISNQAVNNDVALKGYGVFYGGRKPQLKLKMKGFQVALVEPQTTTVVPDAADTDTTIPKIEVSYGFDIGPVALYLAGGYNTHDDVVATGSEYNIDATVLGLGLKFATGPLYANATVYGAKNPGNFGLSDECNKVITTTAAFNSSTDEVEDVDSVGYALVVGFKVRPSITLEAGYGMVSDEYGSGATKTQAGVSSYYLNAKIMLVKGACVVPEIGKINYGDVKVSGQPDMDAGESTYYGAKFQIDF